ncbi:hypothetical protein MN116_004965 [Schistosoma mekongi]|uniref:G-protein coupled receptors family 1 profile domain-containing protein n=1 Tax=Schistosoma mekongi TaxID=38744 RepID=A0AAE1ZDZ2_SCHME|nr:hypothetical protein MN116_004965 [Schistosoma mekongi]
MNPENNASSFYTPWDTLIDCMMLKHGHPNASKLLCNISTFLGTYMAYIFPLIGLFDFISNCIVTTIFLRYLNQYNRQFIYLGVLAISDISIDIAIGWLRWFPTFGLPYASLGKVYYFISLTSSLSCKLYMFCQSIACTFRGNIFMLMALDRLLLTFLCALPCGISYLMSATLQITQHEIAEEFLHFILLFINIGWTLIFLQSSMNIIVYCIRIETFRQILLKPLLVCRNKSSGNSMTPTSNAYR